MRSFPHFRCPKCHTVIDRWQIFAVPDGEYGNYVPCRQCSAEVRPTVSMGFFPWIPLATSGLFFVSAIFFAEDWAPWAVAVLFLVGFLSELLAPAIVRLRATAPDLPWRRERPSPWNRKLFLVGRAVLGAWFVLAMNEFPVVGWRDEGEFRPLRLVLWVATLVVWMIFEYGRVRAFQRWDKAVRDRERSSPVRR